MDIQMDERPLDDGMQRLLLCTVLHSYKHQTPLTLYAVFLLLSCLELTLLFQVSAHAQVWSLAIIIQIQTGLPIPYVLPVVGEYSSTR